MEKELYFLRSSEQYLAKELLAYAVGLNETNEGLEKYPSLEQYERVFGSLSGDIGVYIVADKKIAGGAWVRLLANGFGFVDHDTPELVIAVKPDFRRVGIATEIMEQLFIEVSKVFSQISLSVSETSPALALFEKLGFVKIKGSDYDNGVGGTSFKMLKKLGDFEEIEEEKHPEEECFKKSFRAKI